jgi:hypothetical protein
MYSPEEREILDRYQVVPHAPLAQKKKQLAYIEKVSGAIPLRSTGGLEGSRVKNSHMQ